MAERVVIVGAGVGGLVSAALLASRGLDVTVLESEAMPGGKLRAIDGIDAGPTVFTMRDVFDQIFDDCGACLADHLTLTSAATLARHAWGDGSTLDLHADPEVSEANVVAFAGPDAARGFRRFRMEARRLHDALDRPFLRDSKTDPLTLGWRMGWRGLPDWLNLRAYRSMWSALGSYFPDPRLRQLFGRYTTYCGSSPFRTPATLMLIADVEAQGVWLVEGGMHRLGSALAALAERAGAKLRYSERVAEVLSERGRASGVLTATGERVAAEKVIVNADPAALGAGRFGLAAARAVGAVPVDARSLSALVWLAKGTTSGLPLTRHNVFFSDDYRAEFDAIACGEVPDAPSVYVCAQENDAFQIIVNAPANGDTHSYTPQEIEICQSQMLATLERCGLTLSPTSLSVLTPNDFERLNPSTGGALYGRASHGWAASFRRQGSRTRMPGLYCAGGSTHPGAGVPMAALSGRLASAALLSDRVSTATSRGADIAGGMSTRSPTTAGTG
ncbi:1-hydroxycarotenoid 3,4-desaturase CrtD [Sphingomonas sp. SUN039]|uniref:1-hydroxycarotenoid 3,4-desaturase CrtD n=1 Tax=Sphingomonas sp. SUN039 TaxID=2937787 RepID=UPI002164BD13|nr:1-hydroxycarotenoid 3,4-desaturase CrtD [Sphingomonas sp. SUN039]UVO54134.1 phytoene desaturase family protein [Sphingomonas sp. SUN039]